MPADNLRFYLDENMPVAIAEQLRKRGIDAVTVRELECFGDSDLRHLRRAREQGRVICTNASDFLELAKSGIEHTGIVFGQQDVAFIGAWVVFLELMYGVYQSEELENRVEFQPTS